MFKTPNTQTQMSPEDVMQITLLALAETSINIIRDRANGNSKRLYWLDRMQHALDCVDSTYAGHLPDSFIAKSEKFLRFIESDMGILLRGYKEGSK